MIRFKKKPRKQQHLPDLKDSGRRTFLQLAGGAAISLPLLEFTHGKAWADGSSTECRFLTMFSHGGTISNMRVYGRNPAHRSSGNTGDTSATDLWRMPPMSGPRNQKEALVLGELLEGAGLEPFRNKLIQVEGLTNFAARAKTGHGRHGSSNRSALTCALVKTGVDERGKDVFAADGPSIDHVVAQRLNTVPVHLRVSDHSYGTPYYSGARAAISSERDPQRAYDNLFSGIDASGAPDPAVTRQRQRRGLLLDGVMEGFNRFRGTVSAQDLHVIDAHLEHLNTLSKELKALGNVSAMCDPPQGLSGYGQKGRFSGHIYGPMHVRIMIAAIRCGLTQVANLEIHDLVTMWQSGHGGFGDVGHSLAKKQRSIAGASNEAAWLQEMKENRVWRLGLLRQLLAGLDDPAFPEGDGTILDNSLVLWTSEFSEAASHLIYNQPILMAGSAGGYFETGVHHEFNTAGQANPSSNAYDTQHSTHNLYTSILNAFGQSDSHFGDSSSPNQGPLPGLTA